MILGSTKEKIFYAAIDLFSKNGYRDTTMRMIAKAAGIQCSSIYNHYSSKETILEEAIAVFQSMARSPNAITPVHEMKAPITVTSLLDRYFYSFPDQTVDRDMKIIKIMFSELISIEKVRNAVITKLFGDYLYLENEFRALKEHHLIPDCDTTLLAGLLHSIIVTFTTYSTIDLYLMHPEFPRTNMFTLLQFILDNFLSKDA